MIHLNDELAETSKAMRSTQAAEQQADSYARSKEG